MAEWKLKLRVGDDRRAYEEGEITLDVLCGRYAKEIERKAKFIRDSMRDEDLADEADDIAHDFKAMVKTVAEFDEALERLYDWADTTLDSTVWPHVKLCWVEPTKARA